MFDALSISRIISPMKILVEKIDLGPILGSALKKSRSAAPGKKFLSYISILLAPSVEISQKIAVRFLQEWGQFRLGASPWLGAFYSLGVVKWCYSRHAQGEP